MIDKVNDLGQRVATIFNAAGLISPGTGGGGNGQRQTLELPVNQTISSTTEAVVGSNASNTPLQWAVVPGKYLLTAEITYIPSLTVADSACLRLAGTFSVGNIRCNFRQYNGEGVVQVNKGHVLNLGVDMQSSSMTAAAYCVFEFRAAINCNTSGVLQITARILTSNADTYVIQAYSFATLESVGQTS